MINFLKENVFLSGYVVGCIVMAFMLWLSNLDTPERRQIGHTYQELKEMKESCEKHLTRVEHCVIVVSYKQENKQDIEQEGK